MEKGQSEEEYLNFFHRSLNSGHVKSRRLLEEIVQKIGNLEKRDKDLNINIMEVQRIILEQQKHKERMIEERKSIVSYHRYYKEMYKYVFNRFIHEELQEIQNPSTEKTPLQKLQFLLNVIVNMMSETQLTLVLFHFCKNEARLFLRNPANEKLKSTMTLILQGFMSLLKSKLVPRSTYQTSTPSKRSLDESGSSSRLNLSTGSFLGKTEEEQRQDLALILLVVKIAGYFHVSFFENVSPSYFIACLETHPFCYDSKIVEAILVILVEKLNISFPQMNSLFTSKYLSSVNSVLSSPRKLQQKVLNYRLLQSFFKKYSEIINPELLFETLRLEHQIHSKKLDLSFDEILKGEEGEREDEEEKNKKMMRNLSFGGGEDEDEGRENFVIQALTLLLSSKKLQGLGDFEFEILLNYIHPERTLRNKAIIKKLKSKKKKQQQNKKRKKKHQQHHHHHHHHEDDHQKLSENQQRIQLLSIKIICKFMRYSYINRNLDFFILLFKQHIQLHHHKSKQTVEFLIYITSILWNVLYSCSRKNKKKKKKRGKEGLATTTTTTTEDEEEGEGEEEKDVFSIDKKIMLLEICMNSLLYTTQNEQLIENIFGLLNLLFDHIEEKKSIEVFLNYLFVISKTIKPKIVMMILRLIHNLISKRQFYISATQIQFLYKFLKDEPCLSNGHLRDMVLSIFMMLGDHPTIEVCIELEYFPLFLEEIILWEDKEVDWKLMKKWVNNIEKKRNETDTSPTITAQKKKKKKSFDLSSIKITGREEENMGMEELRAEHCITLLKQYLRKHFRWMIENALSCRTSFRCLGEWLGRGYVVVENESIWKKLQMKLLSDDDDDDIDEDDIEDSTRSSFDQEKIFLLNQIIKHNSNFINSFQLRVVHHLVSNFGKKKRYSVDTKRECLKLFNFLIINKKLLEYFRNESGSLLGLKRRKKSDDDDYSDEDEDESDEDEDVRASENDLFLQHFLNKLKLMN